MKRIPALILAALVAIVFLSACAHGISVQDAANGKAKCGRTYLK
jgi:hypothetical protein